MLTKSFGPHAENQFPHMSMMITPSCQQQPYTLDLTPIPCHFSIDRDTALDYTFNYQVPLSEYTGGQKMRKPFLFISIVIFFAAGVPPAAYAHPTFRQRLLKIEQPFCTAATRVKAFLRFRPLAEAFDFHNGFRSPFVFPPQLTFPVKYSSVLGSAGCLTMAEVGPYSTKSP